MIEMDFKKIAASLATIIATISLLGGATYAFFSDTGTSSSNVFATGTIDLKLQDSDQNTDQENVVASFGGNLAPGSCTGPQTLFLKNTGTIVANHAEVHVSNTVNDVNSDATVDMDSYLRINSLTYDAVDVTAQVTDQGGDNNAFKDLADWAALPNVLDDLALNNLNASHALVLDVCLDNTAPNVLQGDSVTSTFTVELNQDSSQ